MKLTAFISAFAALSFLLTIAGLYFCIRNIGTDWIQVAVFGGLSLLGLLGTIIIGFLLVIINKKKMSSLEPIKNKAHH